MDRTSDTCKSRVPEWDEVSNPPALQLAPVQPLALRFYHVIGLETRQAMWAKTDVACYRRARIQYFLQQNAHFRPFVSCRLVGTKLCSSVRRLP